MLKFSLTLLENIRRGEYKDESLSLREPLNFEQVRVLVDALNQNPLIKVLDLIGCGISDSKATMLAQSRSTQIPI